MRTSRYIWMIVFAGMILCAILVFRCPGNKSDIAKIHDSGASPHREATAPSSGKKASQPASAGQSGALDRKTVSSAEKEIKKKALAAAHERRGMDARYGPLFARLNLRDDEVETLKNVIIDYKLELENAFNKLSPNQGIGTPESDAIIAVQLDRLVENASAIITPDGCNLLRNYEVTLGHRLCANVVNMSLQSTANALSEQQTERLIATLQKHSTVGREILPIIHDEALGEASQFLNDIQMNALMEFQDYLAMRHNAAQQMNSK